MQFEDANKRYEIVFERIRNKGSGSYPMFKMAMEKPVQGEARFEITDIKTQQGYTGINLYFESEIAKALKSKGKDVLIVVAPAALEFVRKTHDEERNKIIEEAQKDPETWRWSTGCDTGNLYISPNTETGWEFRKDLEEIKDTLEKVHKFHAYELFGKEADKNYVSHETVMKIYNEIIEAREQKQAERKAAKEEKETLVFRRAKKSGKPKVIETYTVECEDPREECNTDIVTVYAMPDGTKKKTQNHTW